MKTCITCLLVSTTFENIEILEEINQKVKLEKYDGHYLLSVKEVENAVHKLKQDKKDGATTGLMSNCFLEAPPELFFHIRSHLRC